jgi:hypothetical protein
MQLVQRHQITSIAMNGLVLHILLSDFKERKAFVLDDGYGDWDWCSVEASPQGVG